MDEGKIVEANIEDHGKWAILVDWWAALIITSSYVVAIFIYFTVCLVISAK